MKKPYFFYLIQVDFPQTILFYLKKTLLKILENSLSGSSPNFAKFGGLSANLSELINFGSHWNHQEIDGFLMNSREWKLFSGISWPLNFWDFRDLWPVTDLREFFCNLWNYFVLTKFLGSQKIPVNLTFFRLSGKRTWWML